MDNHIGKDSAFLKLPGQQIWLSMNLTLCNSAKSAPKSDVEDPLRNWHDQSRPQPIGELRRKCDPRDP